MAAPELSQLTAELLVVVQLLAGYPQMLAVPTVEPVPNARLVEMACERPCNVQGWYPGGDTIYLDERLDPVGDLWARSILVHELVHYLQEQDGAFGRVPSCRRWLEREGEAYEIQNRWLMQHRPRTRVPRYMRFNGAPPHCDT